MTSGGRYFDRMNLSGYGGITTPYTRAEVGTIWDILSANYANQASGYIFIEKEHYQLLPFIE